MLNFSCMLNNQPRDFLTLTRLKAKNLPTIFAYVALFFKLMTNLLLSVIYLVNINIIFKEPYAWVLFLDGCLIFLISTNFVLTLSSKIHRFS